jgi:hypothetical protein
VIAHVHVIEFQKRGLPHAHLLLVLNQRDKPNSAEIIDKIVSAEIPEITKFPRLHQIVIKNMIHGPCGAMNPSSRCMEKNQCTKKFPKDIREHTDANVNGFAQYRRRKSEKYQVGRHLIDNTWVVPYNPILSLKYNCHINVEVALTIKCVKYLFKYVYKGILLIIQYLFIYYILSLI